MELVSVIVPVYNAEKYLEECIESILNQSYSSFELILVDDGSEDSSGEICQKYRNADERIRYVRQENKGVSCARNTGLSLANGKYVVFVDSDDIIKEKMFSVLLTSKADFAMCSYELYDDNAKCTISQQRCEPLLGSVNDLANNIEVYFDPPFLSGVAFKLFSREIIEKNGIQFPIDLSYGEDTEFVYRYLMNCKTVAMYPQCLYIYRKHGKLSLSGRFFSEKIDINYRSNGLILEFLKQEDVDNRRSILSERLLNCFVVFVQELVCSKLPNKEKKKVFKQKFLLYNKEFGKPKRMAQRIVICAGRHKVCYSFLYIFKLRNILLELKKG